MTNPVEMVNGKLQHMSDFDTAAYITNQTFAAVQNAQPKLPDTSTQIANLTAAVIALGGTLPDDQVAAANVKLSAIGEPLISVQSLNDMKIL